MLVEEANEESEVTGGDQRSGFWNGQLLTLACLVIIAVSCLTSNFWGLFEGFQWRPSLLAHEVIDGSLEFQTIWMIPNTFTLGDHSDSFLAVVDDQVIFAGSFEEDKSPSLISLDLLTGSVQWDKRFYPTAFANDSNFIYLGQTNGITALNLESGEEVWEVYLDNARNVVYLIADDSSLHVNSSTDNYYKVDKVSGELEDSVKATTRIFVDGDIVYLRSIASAVMTAEDIEGIRLWQTPLTDPFSMKPIFTEDLVLIRTLQGAGPYGQVYVLDRQTGAILWKSSRGLILSNAALSNGVVYYVATDAVLTAVDVIDGRILGTVGFTPAIATTDFVNRRFFVAADDGNVVVHLGDSQQLFAFRFSP